MAYQYKFLIQTLVLFVFMSSIYAQNPYKTRFSYEIENELLNGEISKSRAGLLFSFIGKYNNSIMYSDIPVSWGMDTVKVNHYNLCNALEKILEEAANHDIIIISENHLKPQHRIFASSLINELRKFGFTHLGMETLAHKGESNELIDGELENRGYVLNSPISGTYTMEPQMSNLVRSALNNGYSLFAYERSRKIKGLDRDQIQANNIINYIEKNKGHKFIILCGFHHVIESDLEKYPNINWMTHIIKTKLGMDPLTIYQDNFTEKKIHPSHPILEHLNISEPKVFCSTSNETIQLHKHVDFEVIHPPTKMVNGRPSWLLTDTYKEEYYIKKNQELSLPFFVKAYIKKEYPKGVPVDLIEFTKANEVKPLLLPKEKYIIEIKNFRETLTINHIVE